MKMNEDRDFKESSKRNRKHRLSRGQKQKNRRPPVDAGGLLQNHDTESIKEQP